jgi:histidyl-tRNA synthetase
VGWAGGVERLALLLEEDSLEKFRLDVAVIPQNETSAWTALKMTQDLRAAGLRADQAYRGNLKKRLSKADASKAIVAVLLGEDELKQAQARIKDLKEGSQTLVPLENVVDHVLDIIEKYEAREEEAREDEVLS